VNEGRFQQALELAKQLHKYEPTPENLALLKQAYVGRGKELHTRGNNQDAATVLEAALRIDENSPAWAEQLAVELARCGAVQRAMTILARHPQSTAAQQIQELAADAAVQKQAAGRSVLPPELHADLDRVLSAFGQLERGQDDAARATLQEIGLRSPFLEWKLFLRGLQAYYQNDDERAAENWQRLSSDRVPARLAAPFRFHIDPSYRSAQPPATQTLLQKQYDEMQGSPVLQQLGALRRDLSDPERIRTAFRHAEAVLPALRGQAPHVVPRLANCFYWALLDVGPDEIPRYRRLFGSPPNDPQFSRLEGLATDKCGDFEMAHRAWQSYEKDVAEHPELWPEGQSQQVRALIWLHLGQNAATIPSEHMAAKLPPALRDMMPKLRPLSPAASTCFERSVELMPDLLEAHEALFRYYLRDDQQAKALKAGQRLLAKYPNHVPTLQAYGNLCLRRQDYAEGLRTLQTALAANPLDRNLRTEVGVARLLIARAAAEKKKIDEARMEYQAALGLMPPQDHASIFCRWAAAEFKAGAAAGAEELLQRAQPHGTPLFNAYVMLTETIRLKLPRPLKARFEAAFKEGLDQEPTAKDLVLLVPYHVGLWKQEKPYVGAKTHQSKLLKYVDRAGNVPFSAAELESLCDALLGLRAWKRLTAFSKRGQRAFPKDPVFPYLEAMSYSNMGAFGRDSWKARDLLEKADRLAAKLPREARREELQEEIKRQMLLVNANSPYGLFNNMFGGGMPYLFDEDEYDDEDEDDGYW
jgi:tetratricopeptide (TPR) repeat protein